MMCNYNINYCKLYNFYDIDNEKIVKLTNTLSIHFNFSKVQKQIFKLCNHTFRIFHIQLPYYLRNANILFERGFYDNLLKRLFYVSFFLVMNILLTFYLEHKLRSNVIEVVYLEYLYFE